jgi:Holliday junction resolvase RusA-like endonuclease
MKEHEIDLCLEPLSTNMLVKMHWAQKKRYREKAAWALRCAAIGNEIELYGEVRRRRRVVITLYIPRRFDLDNAYGGQKILIDAMRDVGLIRNDSMRWVDLTINQKISKIKRVHIHIEEDENEMPKHVTGKQAGRTVVHVAAGQRRTGPARQRPEGNPAGIPASARNWQRRGTTKAR